MAAIEGRDVVSSINGFGAKLKRRRRAEGWTQEELGARSGTDQGTISAIEVGRSRPTMDTVRGLAQAFRLPVEELAREAGYLDAEAATDVFDRMPLARIDGLLRDLPVAPGFPSYADQLRQLDAMPPAKQERVLRRLGRDFLWRFREELEREEGEDQDPE